MYQGRMLMPTVLTGNVFQRDTDLSSATEAHRRPANNEYRYLWAERALHRLAPAICARVCRGRVARHWLVAGGAERFAHGSGSITFVIIGCAVNRLRIRIHQLRHRNPV